MLGIYVRYYFGTGIFVVSILMLLAGSLAAQNSVSSVRADVSESISLTIGTTTTMRIPASVTDIVVGAPQIADVVVLSDNSFYIIGKALGVTNITVYDESAEGVAMVLIVRVEADFSELQRSLRSAVPGAQITVSNVNNRVSLTGQVKNPDDYQRALAIASQFSDAPVLDFLLVEEPQQVELDVRILEVQRSVARELGVRLNGSSTSGSSSVSTGAAATTGGAPFGTLVGNLLQTPGVRVDFMINALESKGLARRLANPKLVSSSGVEASFTVGGEVPTSSVSTAENGTVATSTSYRGYGVKLNFLPIVRSEGLITLRIRPEVSDVDTSLSVNGQPAFVTRTVDTTVSLRDGQSFAIAGLISSVNDRDIDQVPWLGDVPVIGALFRSTAFQKRETDLVVLVTPRLVQPVGPSQTLASPLDYSRSSTDAELFLLGMLEVDEKMIRGFQNGNGVSGDYGHRLDPIVMSPDGTQGRKRCVADEQAGSIW